MSLDLTPLEEARIVRALARLRIVSDRLKETREEFFRLRGSVVDAQKEFPDMSPEQIREMLGLP
jgi:hypothetical protein